MLDIEKMARVAHRHHVPLIVDNTFATPVLCKPFDFGADIVTHSTTKYMDGHAVQLGGVIVDSGRFDWTCGQSVSYTHLIEAGVFCAVFSDIHLDLKMASAAGQRRRIDGVSI